MSEIDFVIPWVDGRDPDWQARKAAFVGKPSEGDRMERYRDWDLLRYWFRGVEKFAPWVRYVWFICDQEPPKWLNREHPKLKIVRHEDYLPEEYRPAFSANPIELNLHRIEGLSEQFVYFNDDTYLLRPVKQVFFFKNGLPRDCALLNTIPTDDLVENGPEARVFTFFLNVASYINRDYNFRKCLRKNLFKWFHPCYGKDLIRNIVLAAWPRFVGAVELHLPQAYLKSSFISAWEQDGDILHETSCHHIRDDRDVNQWLIRQRQLVEGKFEVRGPIRDAFCNMGEKTDKIVQMIKEQKHPMVCLNDYILSDEEYQEKQRRIQEAFEFVLPDRCDFEKK